MQQKRNETFVQINNDAICCVKLDYLQPQFLQSFKIQESVEIILKKISSYNFHQYFI